MITVGYGDIYAVSMAGKVITMISSVFGIAIVALPAGIITAGYMEELNKDNDNTQINHSSGNNRGAFSYDYAFSYETV